MSNNSALSSERFRIRKRRIGLAFRVRADTERRVAGFEPPPLPEESDDFSWDDAFDVAGLLLEYALMETGFPADLPPFLVRALQQGPESVDLDDLRKFHRRQALYAASRTPRRPGARDNRRRPEAPDPLPFGDPGPEPRRVVALPRFPAPRSRA